MERRCAKLLSIEESRRKSIALCGCPYIADPGLGLPLVHKPLVRAPLRFASRQSCAQSLPGTLADFPGSPLGGTSAPALPDLQREVGRILLLLPTQLPFSVLALRPDVRAAEPWGVSSILRDPASYRLPVSSFPALTATG